jgi:hypothetical protein
MNPALPWIGAGSEPGSRPRLPRFVSKAERAARLEVYASPQISEDPLDRDPGLRMYRGRTIGMLRRYMRFSLETGRLPSLLGRELFRAKVTSYTVATFEDRVILVHDMEMALQRVSEFSRQVIARYFLQEHDLFATARLLHCNEKTVRRSIPIVLDELSEILLEIGLLTRSELETEKSCQGGGTGPFSASDSNEGENKF